MGDVVVGRYPKQKKDFSSVRITGSCFLFNLFTFGICVSRRNRIDEKEDSLHDIFALPQCCCQGNDI